MPELSPSLRTPEHWRRRAAEARAIAAGMSDPDARAAMHDVANTYDQLVVMAGPAEKTAAAGDHRDALFSPPSESTI